MALKSPDHGGVTLNVLRWGDQRTGLRHGQNILVYMSHFMQNYQGKKMSIDAQNLSKCLQLKRTLVCNINVDAFNSVQLILWERGNKKRNCSTVKDKSQPLNSHLSFIDLFSIQPYPRSFLKYIISSLRQSYENRVA